MENLKLGDVGVDSVALIHLSSLLSTLPASQPLSLSSLISCPIRDIIEYFEGSRASLFSPSIRWDEDATLPKEVIDHLKNRMQHGGNEDRPIGWDEEVCFFLTGANGFVGIHILAKVNSLSLSLILSLSLPLCMCVCACVCVCVCTISLYSLTRLIPIDSCIISTSVSFVPSPKCNITRRRTRTSTDILSILFALHRRSY